MDEAGLVAHQEGGHRTDLGRCAEALQRHLAAQPAVPVLGARTRGALFPFAAGEGDVARRDGVDAHPLAAGDLGQLLGQVVHRRLGGAVGQGRAERAEAGDRADEQDGA
jgi:hypothetical protein